MSKHVLCLSVCKHTVLHKGLVLALCFFLEKGGLTALSELLWTTQSIVEAIWEPDNLGCQSQYCKMHYNVVTKDYYCVVILTIFNNGLQKNFIAHIIVTHCSALLSLFIVLIIIVCCHVIIIHCNSSLFIVHCSPYQFCYSFNLSPCALLLYHFMHCSL